MVYYSPMNTNYQYPRLYLYAFVLSLVCFGCANRNEFGTRRPIYIGKKQTNFDPAVFKLIDTAALYEQEDVFTEQYPKAAGKYNKQYLKFYAGGRVGVFYINDIGDALKDITLLNPKRANLGYYRSSPEGFDIVTHFEHVQGGGFIKEKLIRSTSEMLEFSYDDHAGVKYRKISLPKSALIYSPDW